ncbi:hypothetical protein FA15DRAFT_698462 [Coprinopsis marcescibilis]|uniref:Uncharacterized protein n=1 Tax=Coprinopsis marcescibilis TaxID=230819 RepID=A0A5C3KBD8_COPMA|nr:hypothetical protein FA15DRAFT_698462 [Coprinopsis marcescibilis]
MDIDDHPSSPSAAGVEMQEDANSSNSKAVDGSRHPLLGPLLDDDDFVLDLRESFSALPKGMSPLHSVFLNASKDPRWYGLLRDFVNFEKLNPPAGWPTYCRTSRLPLVLHSSPNGSKNHNKDAIPDLDIAKFGEEMISWWASQQPAWRTSGDTSDWSKDIPADATWAVLHRGGIASLYTIVVGLAWWATTMDLELLWDLVADVAWVMRQFSGPSTASKRKCDGDEVPAKSVSARKRWTSLVPFVVTRDSRPQNRGFAGQKAGVNHPVNDATDWIGH